MRINRRQAIAGLAGALTLPAAGLLRPAKVSGAARAGSAPGTPLFGDQRRVVAAAVDRLLPGAIAAGVPGYIDYWLSQRPFQSVGRHIAHGAKVLDQMARRSHGRPFPACAGKAQDEMLRALVAGEVRMGRFDGRRFFEQLMTFTLEGFLSDPRYGGNRDRVGWRFIGMPDGPGSCWWSPEGVGTVLAPDSGFVD